MTKEDYRIFKISRMKEIRILDKTFERELPEEKKEENYNLGSISLKLEISKEMAYRVYDEFESEEISKNQNGDFIVKVEYPEGEWVHGFILSFGEYVKVLSPDKVRKVVKTKLEKTIKNYL